MARWWVLGASAAVSAMLGCGGTAAQIAPGSVTPGLANAPSLQRTAQDEAIHDVVANDRDACGVDLGRSPLRYHYPACPGVTESRPGVVSLRFGAPRDDPGPGSVVTPWVQHFYTGFPCAPPAPGAGATVAAVAWAEPPASCPAP